MVALNHRQFQPFILGRSRQVATVVNAIGHRMLTKYKNLGASWMWVMKINSWWIYIVYSLPMFLVGILVMPHDVQKKSTCIFLWILNFVASTRSRCCSEKRVVWTLFVPVVQHGVSSAVFYIGTKYVQKACKYGQHVAVQSQCFFNALFLCYYTNTKSTASIIICVFVFWRCTRFKHARNMPTFQGLTLPLLRNARQAFRDLDLDKDGKVSRHLWQHNWVENVPQPSNRQWCERYVCAYLCLFYIIYSYQILQVSWSTCHYAPSVSRAKST